MNLEMKSNIFFYHIQSIHMSSDEKIRKKIKIDKLYGRRIEGRNRSTDTMIKINDCE